MKKIILLILSLFVFSCDSGGDSDLLSQLVGSWSISSYSVESEGVCEEDEEDDEQDDDEQDKAAFFNDSLSLSRCSGNFCLAKP